MVSRHFLFFHWSAHWDHALVLSWHKAYITPVLNLRPAPTRRVQQASVCSCDPAATLPQRPLEASGQSEPIVIDQWVSAVANTRGHDLSVANSVEHDAPDFKHAKHLRVVQLSRRAPTALWCFGPVRVGFAPSGRSPLGLTPAKADKQRRNIGLISA